MAVNLSAISGATTAITALSNLILVSPKTTVGYQPVLFDIFGNKRTSLPPALLFNYEGEQTVTLESDITDHFIEDNTAVQDQIALKPEIVTASGFIGELNDIAPPLLEPIKFLADKLTVVSAYTPALSLTALRAYNQALFLYQTVSNAADTAISAISSLSGQSGESVINSEGLTEQNKARNQNKQQEAFQQFYGYWRKRTLFTVQTPWAVFDNMAIKSLRAVQDAETRMITNFEVTFKLMRFAQTVTTGGGSSQNKYQSRSLDMYQASNPVDLGTSAPATSSTTLSGSVGAITTPGSTA